MLFFGRVGCFVGVALVAKPPWWIQSNSIDLPKINAPSWGKTPRETSGKLPLTHFPSFWTLVLFGEDSFGGRTVHLFGQATQKVSWTDVVSPLKCLPTSALLRYGVCNVDLGVRRSSWLIFWGVQFLWGFRPLLEGTHPIKGLVYPPFQRLQWRPLNGFVGLVLVNMEPD